MAEPLLKISFILLAISKAVWYGLGMRYITDGCVVWDTKDGAGNYVQVMQSSSPESAELYCESLNTPQPPKPLTGRLVLIGNGIFARTKR
jgi:hypothetical protein